MKFRVLDLFSGIGGFSLGLERTGGFETVAFCEIEPFPQKVLRKHWPEVPIYDDVCTLTGELLARDGITVDVITGGFPCQDLSVAGNAKESAKAQEAGCGLKSSDWFARYDHGTSSWRTSQTCLLAHLKNEADGLAEFSETWPDAGMMRNGKTYRLRPWALPHAESVSGLWPTPNKSNGFAPFSRETMLRKERGEARPSGVRMGYDLKWERRCLPYLVDGWINPTLVEWINGLPIGHTALDA